MKTATRLDELKSLAHLLQASLQSKLSPTVPVQVRCLLKEGALVILAQHPVAVTSDQEEMFGFLEQTILAQEQLVSHNVKMYLRVVGQKQPYASHSFNVDRLSESTATATPDEESEYPDFSTAEVIDSNWIETESSQNPNTSATASASPHPWDEPIPGANADNVNETNPDSDRDSSGVATSGTLPDDLPPQTAVPTKPKFKLSLLPLIVAGAGLSLVVFSSCLYVLTRPCVIGQCTAIPEAQALSQRSAKTLQKPQSGKEVFEAQQQLAEAIEILKSIPLWSREHANAQKLLQAYQVQAENVDEMVNALKTAARASYKSENPPHPASRWIEVQNLWREAIAQLEQLPTKSNLQPLAKQKIKAYKVNLAQTNQRLVKERQAQEHIKAAKEVALIAEARQGVAQTLPHWQLVYGTWLTALKRLEEIPQGTTSYKEAQELSALYLPKMAFARDRKTQEQISANAYKQGRRLAQLATDSQANQQWSVALVHWRNALTYMNQVPSDTFFYTKAQSLVGPYTNTLKLVQEQLQLAIKLQQTRKDLNQTCFGKTLVCTYTINDNVIRVRLTPAYMQLVKQTALAAQVGRDPKVQAGVVNHILTLGEALEAISDNARMPVEVYNPDNVLIETHTPGA